MQRSGETALHAEASLSFASTATNTRSRWSPSARARSDFSRMPTSQAVLTTVALRVALGMNPTAIAATTPMSATVTASSISVNPRSDLIGGIG